MHTTRRDFLRTAAAASAGYWLTATARSAERTANGPNGKLLVAVVGGGGQGEFSVNQLAGETLVAFADVDDARAGKTYEKYPGVARFKDFRVLFDKVKPLDAVAVATPDHTHASVALAAMKLGKHVYCEKPLAHNVREARLMTEAAAQAKVATQMGHQYHSEPNYRRAVELVREGVIGTVAEAHGWVGAKYHASHKPTETPPVPPTLDWDLWLGPAPQQPYSPKYVPFNWRAYRDFGTGAIGDMACHIIDPIASALDLRAPTTVTSEGTPVEAEGFSTGLVVRFQFAARGSLPPATVTWYHGDRQPAAELFEGRKPPGSGCLFVGTKGKLLVDHSPRAGAHRLLPVEKFPDNGPPTKLGKHPHHHQEWVNACKTGSPTGSNFAYAGPLTELVLLGNVAHRVGKPLTWDSAAMKCVGCSEADALLRRVYRAGWEL